MPCRFLQQHRKLRQTFGGVCVSTEDMLGLLSWITEANSSARSSLNPIYIELDNAKTVYTLTDTSHINKDMRSYKERGSNLPKEMEQIQIHTYIIASGS